MEEELLKELDAYFETAISNSCSYAERMSCGEDPREALLDMFKIQIDNTATDFVKIIDKFDVDPDCFTTGDISIDDILNSPKEIKVDMTDYIRETKDGTKVFDGQQWFLFSKKAKIDFQVNTDPKVSMGSPMVQVNAYDPETGFRIAYIDYNTDTVGEELILRGDSDGVEQALNESHYWENPAYSMVKKGIGGTGKVSGAVAAQRIFRHYVNYNDILRGPFSNAAFNYANGAGKFKMSDGNWAKFDDIRNAVGSNPQRLKVSANSARMRGQNSSRLFKRTGKICFWVSVGVSTVQAGNALYTDDSNRNEVVVKSLLDITMGVVAFIPVVGWAISGTYFIADAFGAFGEFGQPSGISQDAFDMRLKQDFKVIFAQQIKSLEFDVDYVPTPNNEHVPEQYLEEREVQIDNIQQAPQINIQKIKF